MNTANSLRGTVLGVVATAATAIAQPTTQPGMPFRDVSLPADQRIDDLLKRMTIDEKVNALGTDPSVKRLGFVGVRHVEGLHGLTQGGPASWGRPRTVPTTTFPQAYGLGETWNPDLLRRCAAQEAYECRYILQSPKYAQGGLVVRAPNADLARDPRWGRTEESFGEDPFLTGTMSSAFVHGLQGDHPKYWATASLLKHFLANSNEDDRARTNSNFDQRLFREYFAKPFEMAIVEAGSRAFMASYNSYNGIPCTVHPILRDVTMKEWGNDGIICTDGGALGNLVRTQNYYEDLAQAAAACVKTGINQFLDRQAKPVNDALAQGLLSEADIDERLRGVYRVMLKLGQFDPPEGNPYAAIGTPEHDPVEPWMKDEARALAREAVQQSIVLLKNEGNLLPIDETKVRSIAVIGPRSFEVLGDWYGGTPPYAVSPIDGFRGRVQRRAEARQLERLRNPTPPPTAPAPGTAPALGMGQPAPATPLQIQFAPSNDDGGVTYHASRSDIAVVFVGNHPTGGAGWEQRTLPSFGKEAMDRASIDLEHEELIKRVRAVNPRTVVVLVSSFPYAINWTQENVPAILHVTHSAQELGNGLADVIFGDVSPAGRLTQTWPKRMSDLPRLLDYDIRHGHTYLYAKPEPLYPFGFGLSYTTFAYANLKADAAELGKDGTLRVSVDVTNSGPRDSDDVVQLYVRHVGSAIDRPKKELKAFARVHIPAGQTKTVPLTVPASRLAYWDVGRNTWSLESGQIELQVGASSTDIRLTQTVKINGQAPTPQALLRPAVNR
ncbi:MAG TPA: glycoside hydrolase family 3 C-terminal domain-containing protein [Tepidisphaeraceae bacterium]|jgi:beta-glucosidase